MRALRSFVILVLASMAGTLASCGTMGGGGMKYFTDQSPAVPQAEST